MRIVFSFLAVQGCFPEVKTREFVDNPLHDYDQDGYTEEQGDCDDADNGAAA